MEKATPRTRGLVSTQVRSRCIFFNEPWRGRKGYGFPSFHSRLESERWGSGREHGARCCLLCTWGPFADVWAVALPREALQLVKTQYIGIGRICPRGGCTSRRKRRIQFQAPAYRAPSLSAARALLSDAAALWPATPSTAAAACIMKGGWHHSCCRIWRLLCPI